MTNKPASPVLLPALVASCGSEPFLAKLVGSVMDEDVVSKRETIELRWMVLFLDDFSVLFSEAGAGFALEEEVGRLDP